MVWYGIFLHQKPAYKGEPDQQKYKQKTNILLQILICGAVAPAAQWKSPTVQVRILKKI